MSFFSSLLATKSRKPLFFGVIVFIVSALTLHLILSNTLISGDSSSLKTELEPAIEPISEEVVEDVYDPPALPVEPEFKAEDEEEIYDPRKYDPVLHLDENSPPLSPSVFNFSSTRPSWLIPPSPHLTSQDPTANTPLILRIGIISRPTEFNRRKAIRQYILSQLPPHEVQIYHRFIMGYTNSDVDYQVLEERHAHGDIHILDMHESPARMGEKRWRMLKWAADAPGETYDWYLSMDTDAFVRITALARRVRGYGVGKTVKPREESVLWGNLGEHMVHFVPSSDESSPEEEDKKLPDEHPGSFWYPYPFGFAYLLSSHLVDRLVRPGVVLPHHVRFPSDDVVVGNWIADYAPGTRAVKDVPGFHDPLGHNDHEESTFPVDWETVVAHHLSVEEMRGLRYMEEFKDEWVHSGEGDGDALDS